MKASKLQNRNHIEKNSLDELSIPMKMAGYITIHWVTKEPAVKKMMSCKKGNNQ